MNTKFNHGLSDNLLENKWGIVLDKETRTIESNNQGKFRSDIKPLTCQYREVLLYQRLQRLNCIF